MRKFALLFRTRQTCTVLVARFELDDGAKFYDDGGKLVAAAPAAGLLLVSEDDRFEDLEDLDDFGGLLDDIDVEGWEN